MDLYLPEKAKFSPKLYLLRAGYHEFGDPNTGKTSYVRRLGNNFYPRLHAYLEEKSGRIAISLHLDQKQPSYGGGSHAHSREYDGPVVEGEISRLEQFISRMDANPEE